MGKITMLVLIVGFSPLYGCGESSEEPAKVDGITTPSKDHDAGMAPQVESIPECVAETADIHAALTAEMVVLYGWNGSATPGATINASDGFGFSKTASSNEHGSFFLSMPNDNVVRGDKLLVTVIGSFCRAKTLKVELLLVDEINNNPSKEIPHCWAEEKLMDALHNSNETVVWGWHDSVEYNANIIVANKKGLSVRVESNGEGKFLAVLPLSQYTQVGQSIYVVVSTSKCLSVVMVSVK